MSGQYRDNTIDTQQVLNLLSIKQSSPKKVILCSICSYSTNSNYMLKRHESIHNDKKPFHCYICEKIFSRAEYVRKHFLRKHKGLEYNVKLIIRIDGKEIDVASQFKNVNEAKTNYIDKSLSMQSKIFYFQSQNYKTHKNKKLNEISKSYLKRNLNKCLKKLYTKDLFSNKLENSKSNKCEYCYSSFEDLALLNSHRYIFHRYLVDNKNKSYSTKNKRKQIKPKKILT